MEKPLTESQFALAVDDGLPRLVAVARRLAGDDEIASEAVQNALLKASRFWRRFRGQSDVQTWLTRIVIHCVRDAIAAERRRIRRHKPNHQTVPDDPIGSLPDAAGGPSQRAIDDECRRAVVAAVQALPDRQREVFTLMVWQAMSAIEVGKLLNIQPQAVHSNLHAARKRLRSLLNDLVEDVGEVS